MTASQSQSVCTGPVKPIGLPSTVILSLRLANTMGVSNGWDLHPRVLKNDSFNELSAKRCLFGSPEPNELQNLYKEEMRKTREYILQRYNFDINNEKFVDDNNIKNDDDANINNNMDKCNIINEIVIDNRLHDDDDNDDDNCDNNSCCSTASLTGSTESLSNSNAYDSDCDNKCNLMNNNVQYLSVATNNNNNNNNNISKSTINESRISSIPLPINTTAATLLTSPSSTFRDKKICERQKPYARQILITEYYSSRKTTPTQDIEENQLPKPQKAALHVQERTQNLEDV